MDTKTLILLSIGFLTIATMIWCIIRETWNKPTLQSSQDNDIIIDDQSESAYETIAGEPTMDTGEESIYEE